MVSYTSKASEIFKKYENNDRISYQIKARQIRYIGLWAAEKLFLYGPKASKFAIDTVKQEYQFGLENIFLLIKKSLKEERNISLSQKKFDEVACNLLTQSEAEILKENDIYA